MEGKWYTDHGQQTELDHERGREECGLRRPREEDQRQRAKN